VENGRVENARNIRYFERRLLKEHLVDGVPRFCNAALDESRNDFYKAVLKITRGVVLCEGDLIDDLISTAENIM
jgi:TorA maturation chaperone TorD